MSTGSAIEWTDATWNPVTGCDRISPGCDHCYALTLAKRLKAMGNPRYQVDGDERTSGPGFGVTLHPDKLDEPLHWRKGRRVFVNSMSDLFHQDVPMEFILSVWRSMMAAPQHTFQVLTKRPQRMAKIVAAIAWDRETANDQWEPYVWPGRQVDPEGIEDDWIPTEADLDGGGETPVLNVWLGTSIENDRYAFRANHLRATPAAVRFLSLEPLLGPLPSLDLTDIDWVIVGGESGPGARPMHPDWVRDIRDRCVAAGVAFFFKQWGEFRPYEGNDDVVTTVLSQDGETTWSPLSTNIPYFERRCASMVRSSKKAAGRELDGRTWDECPPLVAA